MSAISIDLTDGGGIYVPDTKPTLRQRMQERLHQQVAAGICRCGCRAVKNYKSCEKCLVKARTKSRDKYRARVGISLDAPVKGKPLPPPAKAKRKGTCNLVKGVVRNQCTDGYGRRASYYVASISVGGKITQRRWSVDKHGEDGAKLCASLQRLLWIIEKGQWNPSDGDPLAIMSYAESFNGNRDYDDCVVTDVSSPWIQEFDRD